MRRPRWVVDTNVLVSAFLWQGTPGRVVELAGEKEVQLLTSRALLDELAATLAKKKLARYVAATGLTADQMLAAYRRMTTLVTARQLDAQVARDADDDVVLKAALLSRGWPPHRRAVPALLEAMALWHQVPVRAVIGVGELDWWSRLGLVESARCPRCCK